MSMMERFTQKINSIMKLPDLRKKIIFTILMFLVVRVGSHIPAPGVNIDKLTSMVNTNDFLNYINMFSGGAFTKVSIFALGVMPYINASIVMQLLTVIIPQLEEIQKEGDSGRQKIVQWTRYLTIFIGGIQAFGVATWLNNSGISLMPDQTFLFTVIIVTILTAGTVFLMWLGEQITVNGIGNGISLIILVNIMARLPSSAVQTYQKLAAEKLQYSLPKVIVLAAIAVSIIAAIVMFQMGQRKIPIQYVGRNSGGGRNAIASKTYLPLKINTAGVMPIIFASVILMLPGLLIKALPTSGVKTVLDKMFQVNNPVYILLYAAGVIFFTFFYTALVFDPEKIAENLKKSGGAVPGIRPGAETVDYLEKVVTRVTAAGSVFLALVAILPMLLFSLVNVPVYLGGTGLLIVVAVALDTVQQIDSHLVMRDYEGFISE